MNEPTWASRFTARLKRGSSVALALGALAGLFVVGVTPCPVAGLLGLPCPGCGLTRASVAMLHGDWALMLRWHPLAPLLAPIVVVLVGLEVGGFVWRDGDVSSAGSPLLLSRLTTLGALLVLLIAVGVWLARFAGAFGGPVPVARWW